MPIQYTTEAAEVLRRAQGEAHRLAYPFIQREQLFLGLLHNETVGRILTMLGLDLQSTRQEVENRMMPGLGAPDEPGAIGMLPTAEQVYQHRAQTAAALLGHTAIGPEDILLGFLLEQHGVVLEVLVTLGASKDRVIDTIKRLDT